MEPGLSKLLIEGVSRTFAGVGGGQPVKALMPIDLAMKGYLAMGVIMLVQSCITLTKTVRDVHESSRFVNRIEDAKAERLLMEVSKAS